MDALPSRCSKCWRLAAAFVLCAQTSVVAQEASWVAHKEWEAGHQGGSLTIGSIVDARFDRDGNVWLLDGINARVWKLSATGQLLFSFGRQGQGPGEFGSSLGGLAVLDTVLAIADVTNRSLKLFSFGGDALGSVSIEGLRALPTRWDVAQGALFRLVGPPLALPGASRFLIDTTSVATPTVQRFSVWDGRVEDVWSVSTGGGGNPSAVLAEIPLWALLDDGESIIGTSSSYRLVRVDPQGDSVGHIEREVGRRPVSPRIRRSLQEAMESALARPGIPANARDLARRRFSLPDSLPVISRVLRGHVGHVLVLRGHGLVDGYSPAEVEVAIGVSPSDWDVFSQDGSYTGVLPLEPGWNPLSVQGDRMLIAEADEFGTPILSLVRIRRR